MIVSVNGSDVYVSDGGLKHQSGQKALLLIHGSGVNHAIWALQSHDLARRGINVFSLDLPGHGRSEGPLLTSYWPDVGMA
jgi:pimeloyl-ACP methyl ester carboxylesterase